MSKYRWRIIAKVKGLGGEREIIYKCDRFPALTVYSRRVRRPHANGEGGWLHTSYFAGCDGVNGEKEFMSLEDAKEYAETVIGHSGIVGERNE